MMYEKHVSYIWQIEDFILFSIVLRAAATS